MVRNKLATAYEDETRHILNFWMMASVYSLVDALPPRSPVINLPSAMV